MKKIEINKIVLENFKGQTREIELTSSRTEITGYNGCGKTTIYNALLWVLTGRDTAARVNHQLYDNKREISPETPPAVVSVTLSIDNVTHTLTRTATPRYTRPKGSTEYVKATSDDYTFDIDGLQYKSSEFMDWINFQIAPQDKLIYLLAGEVFAHETIDTPASARKKLIDLIGGKFNFSDNKYASIIGRINQIGLDKFLDECNGHIRQANSFLADIPVKISMYENEIAKAAAYKEVYAELVAQEDELRKRYNSYTHRPIRTIKSDIRDTEKDVAALQMEIEKRKSMKIVDVCPTCGQALPDDSPLRGKAKVAELSKNLKAKQKRLVAYNEELEVAMSGQDNELQSKIDVLNEITSNDKRVKAWTDEIENLKSDRAKYSQVLAENERNKMLAKDYEQEYAILLSEAINQRLQNTRIEMFETQKNGEQKSSCVITDINGVKYTTLNYASRLLSNIELSRLFCELLDVNMPCFVDECSVFDSQHLPNIEGTQMIYMKCADNELQITELK